MKTRIIITATILFLGVGLASASSNMATLTFYDAHGRTMTMPVMEEVEEPVPFEISTGFHRTNSGRALQVIDISDLSKPEKEEALPFDLEKVLRSDK